MGLGRRLSRKGLYGVREALRSVGPKQGVLADLAALRQQVESNTRQIELSRALVERTSSRTEDVVKEVDVLARLLRDNNAGQTDWSGHRDDIERRLSKLNIAVSDLGEGVHFQRGAIRALESRLERLAGSVFDETAVKRRLERIEDRVLDPDPNTSSAARVSEEPSDGAMKGGTAC